MGVFLKQLTSGLLLVSGPYKLNGVPLRRVNQAYVIATSTSVDVSKVNVPENVDDAYFKAPKKAKKAGKFFAEEEKPKNTVSDARKADQSLLMMLSWLLLKLLLVSKNTSELDLLSLTDNSLTR